MFSQDQEIKYVDVTIIIADGEKMQGKLACGLTGSIASSLNGEGRFVEFVDMHGKTSFIAKHQLLSVEPAKNTEHIIPKLKAGNLRAGNWERVLGVCNTATPSEVKAAYHRLAKQYHPDAFSLEMPAEIRQYASEMLSQINVAYDQYKSFKQAA